jgi:phage FluMu gp28-like protein
MKKVTFSTQERRLAELIKQWRPYKCLIDGTNVGAGIAESLSERFGTTVEKIVITRITRPLWISNLIGFTRRSETCLHVPDTNEVWEDFLSVERYINKEGKEDFFIPSHKERGHGDRFMALVLCLEAFTRIRSLARYTLENDNTLQTEMKSQKEISKEIVKSGRRRSRMAGM